VCDALDTAAAPHLFAALWRVAGGDPAALHDDETETEVAGGSDTDEDDEEAWGEKEARAEGDVRADPSVTTKTQVQCWATLALRCGFGVAGVCGTLGTAMRRMLRSEQLADVRFLLLDPDKVERTAVPLHRVVLAARCPRLLDHASTSTSTSDVLLGSQVRSAWMH
jgi:hypothetical protein